MRTKYYPLVLLMGLIAGFLSCKGPAPEENAEKYTRLWLKGDSSQNIAILQVLYAPKVLFYGTPIDAKKCLARKAAFFAENPDYAVTIDGNIAVTTLANDLQKATFKKVVTVKGKAKSYQAYLTFRKTGTKWEIIEEGDTTTDYNLRRKKEKADHSARLCTGDFNGDGKQETVTMIPPKIKEDDMDCEGDCTARLRFSDPTLPDIILEQCIGGVPVNHGDLNGDGTDELGISPDWFTSCWRNYRVYTLINNRWQDAVDPFSTHCQQWDDNVIPIEKDPQHPGNAIIHYMVLGDEEFNVHTQSVTVRR